MCGTPEAKLGQLKKTSIGQLVLGFCLFICGIVAIAASIPCDGECQAPCTTYAALHDEMRGLALFGLIPGLLTLMFGGLGVAGATKRSKCMVGAHLGVTILCFILCIIGAYVAFWTSFYISLVCGVSCIGSSSSSSSYDSSSSSSSSSRCAAGCPPSYPGDGLCDSACNNAACNYDDGDCGSTPTQYPTAYPTVGGQLTDPSSSSDCAGSTGYCPASYPGDGFCDFSCNIAACNYDNGDCDRRRSLQAAGEYFGADIGAATGLDQGHFDAKTILPQLSDTKAIRSSLMSTSYHAHRKLATCTYTVSSCLSDYDEGKVFCDHYGGTMWAVCAFCIILSTYNLVVAIIGCCACCNMDKIKEAPATSAGMHGASPVAVIVNPMPVLTMAVPVTVPDQQMQVTVPDGASAGQTLTVMAPSGQQIAVTIPYGAGPGSSFMVSVPAVDGQTGLV